MKKIFVFLCLFVLIIGLASCSQPLPGKAEKWTEKDFSFYDADGEERAFVSTREPSVKLSDYPDLSTYRKVKIGDKAETALKKYLLPYDYTLYGVMKDKDDEIFRYTKGVDLQKEIEKCAYGENFSIILTMTDELEYYDAYDSITGDFEFQERLWRFFFIITDEKISDIWIAHW